MLKKWHDFVCKHTLVVHLMVALVVGWAIFSLRSMTVDSEWLNLFGNTDSVVQEYRDAGVAGNNLRSIFLRVEYRPSENVDSIIRSLADIKLITVVAPLGITPTKSRRVHWFHIIISEGCSDLDRKTVVVDVRRALDDVRLVYGITGAQPILDDFQLSVEKDFVRSSLFSLLLVSLLMLLFFGRSWAVLLGIFYQLSGLIVALAICLKISGSLNMLSAALPCVLLGLGVDFVIHCLSVARNAEAGSLDGQAGLAVYTETAKPMFWGALTTSIAFFSLSGAQLKGLASVGLLGGLGVLFMFGFVILLLPPMLSRLPFRGQPIRIPWIAKGRNARLITGLVIAVLYVVVIGFVSRVRMEEKLENLYDPDMPSLRLQEALKEDLGAYPSMLYFVAETKDLTGMLQKFMVPGLSVQADPLHVQRAPTAVDSVIRVTIPLVPVDNPFEQANTARISDDMLRLFPDTDFYITGDAVLSHHMNDLLIKGMTRVFLVVFLLMGIVLWVAFRKMIFVVGPLLSLLLTSTAVLGCMGLMGITISAYTLSLFPLFVGIGIDDCFYVGYTLKKGRTLDQAGSVVYAITLTTLTTMLGYGSLFVARNVGFQSMGQTAVLGLFLLYLGALYILPAFLEENKKE